MTELTEKDRVQLETADRLRRMSELHAYSRSLLGLNPLPLRARLRNRVQGFGQAGYQEPSQVVYESAPQIAPEGKGERRMGFGILQNLGANIRGVAQARQTQVTPEELEAEEEKQKQLLEESARRRAREAEVETERLRVKALAKARESISIVEI